MWGFLSLQYFFIFDKNKCMKKIAFIITVLGLIVAIVEGYYSYVNANIAKKQLEIAESQKDSKSSIQSPTANKAFQAVPTNKETAKSETNKLYNSRINQVNINTSGVNIGENNGTVTVNQ